MSVTEEGDCRLSRRTILRMSAGLGLGSTMAATATAPARAAESPIVKPLPPELFVVYGSNAEM